jgi:hypothetical protein
MTAKERLSREVIAMRIAKEFFDGAVLCVPVLYLKACR